jgi:TolB protein
MTRASAFAAALLSVVTIAALGHAPAQAAFPGGNGRIAYVHGDLESGTADIYTVDPDGSDVQQLTTTGDALYPSWSPGGDRILFTRLTSLDTGDSDLWVMNADGSDKTQLTSGAAVDEDASWAPDGRRVVFSSNRSGSVQLHVLDPATGSVKRITSRGTTNAFAREPSWSPLGTVIAFSRSSSTGQDIYTVRPDGTGLRRLTTTAQADENSPDWAPSSSRLTYTRHTRSAGLVCTHAVYTVRRDGTGTRRIFDTGCEDWHSAWSPDGRRIALHSDGPLVNGSRPRAGIWTVKPDGTARAFIATTAGSGVFPDLGGDFPDWQPVA